MPIELIDAPRFYEALKIPRVKVEKNPINALPKKFPKMKLLYAGRSGSL